jgi:hypothetical protein
LSRIDCQATHDGSQKSKLAAKESIMTQPTAEQIAKTSTDALTESGHASSAALQELSKAYQEMAVRNANNLTVAMKELAGVKSPSEFIVIQQRLIKDGVQAAVTDSQNIAHLTAAVFTAAFEPVKKQIEAMQKPPLH